MFLAGAARRQPSTRGDSMTRLNRRQFLTTSRAAAAAVGTRDVFFPAIVDAQEPIRIGQLIPFTGFLGAIGEYGKQGATLAVEELNEKGGVMGRKLELITEDEANPGVAVQKARKLIEKDRVVALVPGRRRRGAAGEGPPHQRRRELRRDPQQALPSLRVLDRGLQHAVRQ